jgi:glyoxylate reductase
MATSASKVRVATSTALIGDALDVLRSYFDVIVATSLREADLADVAGVVSLLTDPVDAALLARAPALKVVANVAVGVDNIDRVACAERGIIVTNTPDVLTEATADLAFGLLLDAARRISEGDRLVRAGGWNEPWKLGFHLGTKVHGMKLGIVGFGRIGMAVARRARGFGMHVGYTQKSRVAEGLERTLGATFVPDLDALCVESDAVTIHCPLTEETRGLFGAERLARMKRGAILVNTSRGPIVDEAALAAALEHGPLGAAGIDVFTNEPAVHSALLARSNAVLTPHIGSADRETREKMAATAAANVIAVLCGKPALTPVR